MTPSSPSPISSSDCSRRCSNEPIRRPTCRRLDSRTPIQTCRYYRCYALCMELLTHDEIARLTRPERLALISRLWDSLEDDQLPLTPAQCAELDSRLATLDQDRRNSTTWETLK